MPQGYLSVKDRKGCLGSVGLVEMSGGSVVLPGVLSGTSEVERDFMANVNASLAGASHLQANHREAAAVACGLNAKRRFFYCKVGASEKRTQRFCLRYYLEER